MDREKVIKGLECCSHTDGANCIYCPYDIRDTDCTALMSMDVLSLLKEQEAKTGKWIEQDGYDGDVYYDCSACGESWVMIDGTPQENGMLYCPHCGAKMEAGEE